MGPVRAVESTFIDKYASHARNPSYSAVVSQFGISTAIKGITFRRARTMCPHQLGFLLKSHSRRLADLDGIAIGLADFDFPFAHATIKFHLLPAFQFARSTISSNDHT